MSQVFLLQKPFHEHFEHFACTFILLHEHLQRLWACQVLLYLQDLLDHLLRCLPELRTDFLQFLVVNSGFHDLDSLLANVEANILGFGAFGSWFFIFGLDSLSFVGILVWLCGVVILVVKEVRVLVVVRRDVEWLKEDRLLWLGF